MSFHEVLFPIDYNYGSAGGPGYNTNVVETDGGVEQRIARLGTPRHRYDVSYAIRTYADISALRTFYIGRQGPAHGFRFKDWLDYSSNASGTLHNAGDAVVAFDDQQIDTGTGVDNNFQLRKTYPAVGGTPIIRVITKPVEGTVLVGLNGINQGSGWTVNKTTGIVTFTTPPSLGHAVTAGYEFDVPVRFGEGVDEVLSQVHDNFGSGSIPAIDLVEIVNPLFRSGDFYYGGATDFGAISASISISLLNGRVINVEPQTSGLEIFLPDVTVAENVPKGGPHFWIKNDSGAETMSIRTACDIVVSTLAVNEMQVIILGADVAGDGMWIAMA